MCDTDSLDCWTGTTNSPARARGSVSILLKLVPPLLNVKRFVKFRVYRFSCSRIPGWGKRSNLAL